MAPSSLDPSSGPCIVEDPRGQIRDRGRQREDQDFKLCLGTQALRELGSLVSLEQSEKMQFLASFFGSATKTMMGATSRAFKTKRQLYHHPP